MGAGAREFRGEERARGRERGGAQAAQRPADGPGLAWPSAS